MVSEIGILGQICVPFQLLYIFISMVNDLEYNSSHENEMKKKLGQKNRMENNLRPRATP